MEKPALILFVRNPELGNVKTRIANTAGDEKALDIYEALLRHTINITQWLPCDKYVFYADYKNENDGWDNAMYRKKVQQGADLGEKMCAAFEMLFEKGYTSICIIGSDCMSLSKTMITEAFKTLQSKDVVIGPSTDGGYYLLGMKQLHGQLFNNKKWNSDKVLPATIQDVMQLSLSCRLLPMLSSINTEADWNAHLKMTAV